MSVNGNDLYARYHFVKGEFTMQATEINTFSEVRRLSQVALETGNFTRLQTLLVPLLREDDRSRSADENLFIYRTLGVVYEENGQKDEALLAFEQAYHFDKRDFKSLEARVENELTKTPAEVDTGLLLEFLVFHRSSLKNSVVMRIFRAIGESHRVSGDYEAARECYEKALEARPGDMEIIHALLDISKASGDDDAVIKAREKLLASMTSAESRAAILVSIGDDYLNIKKDEQRALETYEEAILECNTSIAALQRILVVAEHKGDWDRCLSACETLVKAASEEDEKAKYLLKMAAIFEKNLHNSKRAIQLFNDVLDLKPDQLDVFKAILAMLQAENDFAGMEENYERMIERQRKVSPINTKLLAMLCKNLGDIRLRQFNNIPGAASAYQIASDLFPDKPEFHMYLAKLYAVNDDTLEKAIYENRQILRLMPNCFDAVKQMAECHVRLNHIDEALNIYRVLSALGNDTPEGSKMIDRFQPVDVPVIQRAFTDAQWKRIRPNTLNTDFCEILSLTAKALWKCFTNELSLYGLSKHDRVDLNAPTLFSRTLKNAQQALGFADLPQIYRWDKKAGILNAYIEERAFLVHSTMFSGKTEQEVAFATAKSLLLMRPEFYFMQHIGPSLDKIFPAIFKTACPQLNLELKEDQMRIQRVLEKVLSPNELARIAQIVKQILANKQYNVNLFVESVEDYANRVGLIFCDDPRVIEKMLAEESRPFSKRDIKSRLGSLLLWALSDDYAELRASLGIKVTA